ncbi:helix-turn-helix domain-containing protein [Vagococcus penaei]|uniref:helix-turn-helix domain-containing protein n=1 Tax=Vagococcus penaei TaxID=633807 RepID=UPI001E5DF6A5|nr:helix-turn-helix transcriptional regulator [Vagococcus penaei]
MREIRQSKGMIQQELADKANLSLPFISFIENGKRIPSLESFIVILEVFDMSLSEFFLPYSQDSDDEELLELLVLLQKSPHKDEYIGLFLEMLKLS